MANVVKFLPQLFTTAIDGSHVLNLVTETLVGAQRVDVAVKLCKGVPVFHLCHMVKYHAQCVCTCDVKGKGIASALDNAASSGADAVTLVGIVKVFGLIGTGIGKYLQWEVMLNSGHGSTKHSLVRLVVLVARLHKELVLQPVGKFYQSWVKHFFDVCHILLGDTHLAQLHTSVKHLVHHVDVHEVALRHFALLHFTAIPKRDGSLWQLADTTDKVSPRLHLATEQLCGFGIKDGILVTHTIDFFLTCIYPTSHEAVVKIALTVGTLASEHSQHLVKGGERSKQE